MSASRPTETGDCNREARFCGLMLAAYVWAWPLAQAVAMHESARVLLLIVGTGLFSWFVVGPATWLGIEYAKRVWRKPVHAASA